MAASSMMKRTVGRVLQRVGLLPGPADHADKQALIRELADRYGTGTLVETGTYLGDMVAAMLGRFDRIISIELSEELYQRATDRFAGEDSVVLMRGDSGEKIADAIAMLDGPAIFWLDGHYSGGVTASADLVTPIMQELETIFALGDAGHVVIIDDARLFGRDPGYPTVAAVRACVAHHAPWAELSTRNDALIVTAKV